MCSTLDQRIDCIGPDLYSARHISKRGQPLYFGCERITACNRNDWWNYAEQAIQMAGIFSELCRAVTSENVPEHPNLHSKELGWDAKRYNAVTRFIQNKRYFEKNPFRSVAGHATSTSLALRNITPEQKVYMVFASCLPIKRSRDFENLVMSFICYAEDSSPTVSYSHAFRNPLDFLNPDEPHKNLSMELHGFAATLHCPNKKYMAASLEPNMIGVMSLTLGSNLHLGANLDLIHPDKADLQKQELLTKHPPIYHIGSKVHKIAMEGVVLSQYLEELPDEQAAVIGLPGESLYGPQCMRCMIAVVNLTKLSNVWQKTTVDTPSKDLRLPA